IRPLYFSRSPCNRWTWLHLVLLRLLGRWNQFHRAALGLDFLRSGLGEVMGLHKQALGQFAIAQDAHAVRRTLGETGLPQGLGIYARPIRESLVQGADINDQKLLIPG